MINKISFTGRETMLTKGIKEDTVKKLHEYVGAGKIYTEDEIELVRKYSKPQKIKEAKAEYTSPFAPTENIVETNNKEAAKNGYLYNLAHGKPPKEAEQTAAEVDNCEHANLLDILG